MSDTNHRKTSTHLGTKVTSKLFVFFAVNLTIWLSVLFLLIYLYQSSSISKSRELLLNNLAATLQPIVQRFDLADTNNILASISSTSQISALELIDFYGTHYPSNPDIRKLGDADASVMINGTLGETGTILVWWDRTHDSELFLTSISATILIQFLASCILGWYGLQHYINKLIAQPLADLQSHINDYDPTDSRAEIKDLGASELNDVYDTFNDVQQRLLLEHQEKELALQTLKSEVNARRTLVNDISHVLSLANRSIRYYPLKDSHESVHIGHRIPAELDELLSQPNISVEDFLSSGRSKGWKIKTVEEKTASQLELSGTFHLEAQLDQNSIWSIAGVPTTDGGSAYLCMDISTRKAIELQERNTHHLKSLGVLTSGVAHDFNNILAIIMASIESNTLNLESSNKTDYAMDAIVRGKMLVSQLLNSSRGIERQVVNVDLQDVFRYLERIFNCDSHPDVNFSFVLEDSQLVSAEDGLVESTISNLIINSCQAMNLKGSIIVQGHKTRPLELKNLVLDKHHDYYTIEVIDEGPGVTESIIDQIFDPFYTTKNKDQGTGLGLSMARGFAQRSGGEAFYRKAAGGGAVFGIVLPTVPSLHNESTPSRKKTEKANLNGQRIILVDDEVTLLDLLSKLLVHLGLETVQATDCQTAYTLIEQTDFDWILSDMYMPDGNGLSVLEYARKQQPNAKRILMSGNILYSDLNTEQSAFVDEVLQKPYTLKSLKQTLDTLSEQ